MEEDSGVQDIVRVENLTFQYPPSEEGVKMPLVIDGISFSAKPGTFVAVLGQNGSGKSTLSQYIAW